MKHPYINTLSAPLYVVTFGLDMNHGGGTSMLAEWDDFYSKNRLPFVLVLDFSAAPTATLETRRRMSEHEGRWHDHKHAFCLGTAMVMKSALHRSIVQAFFWVSPPGYPYAVFSDIEPAMSWAREQMSQTRAA